MFLTRELRKKGIKGMRLGKHGMFGTAIYTSWQDMKARCNNPNSSRFMDYGGRGIKVCDRWNNSFQNFYSDMGRKPKNKSLDRIDNDGDYAPDNCKWSTEKQQANNKRNNVFLEFDGFRLSFADWSKRLGIKYSTLRFRIKSGWSVEKTLTMIPTKGGYHVFN